MLVLARENHLQMPRKHIQLLLSLRQPRCREGMERNQLSHQQLQFRAYSLVRPCDSGPLEELLDGFLCPERLKMSTSLLTRRGLSLHVNAGCKGSWVLRGALRVPQMASGVPHPL